MHVAIIGAGPSGITAAKNCQQAGIPFTLYERGDKVGGNWVFDDVTGHSSVYENTHIISSKTLSSYEDFPMPASYPDYPSHRQVQAFFEDYARHFGVLPQVAARFIGFSTYQFDANVRNSTMVGIVGAGGIGAPLFVAFQRFDYDVVCAILIAIVAVVFLCEILSNQVKRVFGEAVQDGQAPRRG